MPAQFCPTPRELDDLELLLHGGLAPLTTFEPDGPISLDLPEDLRGLPEVEIVDPEGLPLARLTPAGLETLTVPAYGPFRRLMLDPAAIAAQYDGALTVPVAGPLTSADLDAIGAARAGRRVLLLALTGTGTPQGLTAVGLVRASLAAADLLGDAGVVSVPLASHGDPDLDHRLGQVVAGNYAPGEVLAVTGTGELPEPVAAVVAQDQPEEPGVVVFFTGLSGSGKSTLAQALLDRVLERGERTVTSLDGDVVRRNLSAGLTFSKADRETNIRRIGWVAAEIARHRGVAICSPIAPFDETRQQVRAMVEDAGGIFVLVHVATPLEECERRDRKGLYAKARAGEIPEFTGISSPYEEPADATVRVDTTGRSVEDALSDVLAVLPFD
ncbi:adenylyl-sulfate kinase [Marmoricola sp. RAF53]|uniref:adenylyl-sulfate kinase n=1 Tax=Marmoricola sp. RAF53 TaxID=3233059 RepID=UPI003F964385